MSTSTLNKKDFDQFREFLERVCGIVLSDNKDYLVSSRLRGILKELKLESVGQLIPMIERDTHLCERVVDAMTTNETLWFRDAHPFKILEEILLPEFAEKQRSFDLWCAASSTGQEPYSISIILEEFKRKNPGKFTAEKMVATDISPTALASARAGEYDKLALGRGMPEDTLKRYFDDVEEGRWRIKSEISRRIQFRSLNLLHSYSLLGKFDVVFCRNVLIYFSSDVKLDILTRIHAQLKPGGYLFLGASEALNGLPDLYEMVHCHPGIIYKKR